MKPPKKRMPNNPFPPDSEWGKRLDKPYQDPPLDEYVKSAGYEIGKDEIKRSEK